jgi:hypothetical protein
VERRKFFKTPCRGIAVLQLFPAQAFKMQQKDFCSVQKRNPYLIWYSIRSLEEVISTPSMLILVLTCMIPTFLAT